MNEKLYFCRCTLDGKHVHKHIAAKDEESAFQRFAKEVANNNKYIGSIKIKEIKYIDNCKVKLVSKDIKREDTV